MLLLENKQRKQQQTELKVLLTPTELTKEKKKKIFQKQEEKANAIVLRFRLLCEKQDFSARHCTAMSYMLFSLLSGEFSHPYNSTFYFFLYLCIKFDMNTGKKKKSWTQNALKKILNVYSYQPTFELHQSANVQHRKVCVFKSCTINHKSADKLNRLRKPAS